MLFWLFILICTLLLPLVMIIYGFKFKKSAPKNINYIYGYRTQRSTASNEAWKFAHNYFGKLWFITGIILVSLTIIAMMLVIGLDKDTVSYTGMTITFIQLFLSVIPIIPTEIALRKTFDENGNRKI